MIRNYMYSFAGHVAVLGTLAIAAKITARPAPPPLNIYQVQAVSSQSVADLIKKSQPAPVSNQPKKPVPQIKTEAPALPQEHRKEAQEVKRSEPDPTPAISNEESAPKGVQGIQTDTEFDYPEYLIDLQERIRSNWRPPTLRVSLNTRVYFKIARNGTVLQAYVEQPSGTIAFDASARNAVIASDPFPPLPENYENDTLGVHFDFIYRAN